MATQLYLVLIETSGNQAFIFSTNKLKENVGASEATYRACSQWILDAVEGITTKVLWDDNADQLKANLCESTLNPAIEDSEQHLVEVIVAASGKAILITRELCHARRIIQEVTLQALKKSPGLDVCGAIEPFEWEGEVKLPEVSRRLHQKFEVVRSMRPGPDLRFLRLPIVEDCRTSGLPAATIESDPDERLVARSKTTLKKRNWADGALKKDKGRLPKLLEGKPFEFAESADKIQDDISPTKWLAVIHADGNGLGQIFIKLEEYVSGDRTDDRNYIKQFREFSLALDVCTRRAFVLALEAFPEDKRNPLPLVPLVLGGDDLTVVCDATYALEFTKRFLEAFEEETKASMIISEVAAKAFGIAQGRLSACAGIAIVKPHFPFSTAYQLAEELAKSAKVVKDIVKKDEQVIPCSAIDYHVVYDTHGIRLEGIRDKLTFAPEKTHLYNRPYVVSKVRKVDKVDKIDGVMEMVGEDETLEKWLNSHHWTELERRVNALLALDDDGRRKLPNSQMHALREGLFIGKDGANAQYQLIRKRYIKQGIKHIAAFDNPESLFWQDASTENNVTGFLDAMDAADFWKKTDESGSNENSQEAQS